ncbi:unnamed protein product [Toxocara canis]|uniref:C-type lectin domain-containing protein n=1 Tax=Toxocara canis TaxID=6265 RepID=A0A3P7IRU7_TOXCA|nr:unnamed protein product [Toxocara canis]
MRQFNTGFWFQPDGASKWDDGTAYNSDVWPGFPESMPELTGYSCVNLDPETGKPVMGDCALLYDVVVCEQRCVGVASGSHACVKCRPTFEQMKQVLNGLAPTVPPDLDYLGFFS